MRLAFSITPRDDKILVKKMKGSTAGKTLNAQAEIPFNVSFKYISGKMTMFKTMNIIKIVKRVRYFFKINLNMFDKI